jgi:hypothetical protein
MRQDLPYTRTSPKKVVYLASCSSDVQAEADKIRRELTARGYEVLPDRPLSLVGSELEAGVRGYLARSQLSVHPLGGLYGIIPEGEDCSIIELQLRLAADAAATSKLSRIIWLARGLRTRDTRQESLLRAIREDPALHSNAEVVQTNLEELKGIMLEKLNPPGRAPTSRTDTPVGRPRVYLMCDKNDQAAIEPIEDFLFAQGLEVSLPDFEADEAEAAETHRQLLLDSDGVLIFYGAARNAWVDIKLRSVLKAGGYGRATDFAACAVYVAPPVDRRKERFRTHMADVVVAPDPFDSEVLRGFVKRLRQAKD